MHVQVRLFSHKIVVLLSVVVIGGLLMAGCVTTAPQAGNHCADCRTRRNRRNRRTAAPAATAARAATAAPQQQPRRRHPPRPRRDAAGPGPGNGRHAGAGDPGVQGCGLRHGVTHADARHLRARRAAGRSPSSIDVHGGGFMMGDKSNPALADQLLDGRLCGRQRELPAERRGAGPGADPGRQGRGAASCAPTPRSTTSTPSASRRSASRRAGTWWRCWAPRAASQAVEGAELGNADVIELCAGRRRLVRPHRLPADGHAVRRHVVPRHARRGRLARVQAGRRADPDRAREGQGDEPDHLRRRQRAAFPDPARLGRLQRAAPAEPTALRCAGRQERRRTRQRSRCWKAPATAAQQFETAENVKLVVDFLNKALAQ